MKNYFILLLFVSLSSCYGKKPKANATGKEGKLMPAFSMLLSDSTTFFNTANIPPGRPSVLFLFGPHCPYSKAQMKVILQNMDKLKDIHFYLITNYPVPDMRQFYSEFQLSKYPNITIGQDTSSFFTDYLEIPGVPFMAFYDKNKKLKKTFIGKIYSNVIISSIEDK